MPARFCVWATGKGTEAMGREMQARTSFLHNLLHDKTANTLAIAAASLIPMMAMVGGGIDASRYYMAAARMQAACDAGALAARRAMPTTVLTADARTQGLNFFDQNFNDGLFGVTNRSRNYIANSQGRVIGAATGTLPSTIMAAFGYNSFPISVTCSAEVNISNTDIVFVLDVTGSMADCPATSGCNSGPGSKIVGMRSAVMSFYDTVESATSASAQVRYGLVPYSQQANVGFAIPRVHMVNNHTYQSRVARFNPAAYPNLNEGDEIVVSDQVEWLPRTSASLNNTNTDNYRYRTDGTNGTNSRTACTNFPGTYTVTVFGVPQTWQVFAPTEFVLDQWSGGDSNNRAGCRARIRKTRRATATDVNAQFRDWVYCPVTTGIANPCGVTNPARSRPGWDTVNFSNVYTNNRIDLPIGSGGAMTTVAWEGCIEEPDTVSTDNYSPIPANAHDLNINLVPANESQRWRPALINAVWKREDSNGNQMNWLYQTGDESRPGWTCPRPARRLADITRNDLQAYVDALRASGNTYHDIGMLWGARFISPRGLFAADNNSAPNGEPISRHIVFMTDGAQVNNIENYSSHGIEWWDRRLTGNGNSTTEFNRRAARLQAICRAAQQENITVWVVAFGTTLTQNLRDCASPGRAFQATDNAALTDQFRQIAQKIAALRLTQ
jgi:Flp pilus assembly protein TadG